MEDVHGKDLSIFRKRTPKFCLHACTADFFQFFLAITARGTLVKNMIYRRQCTQKSPRHNIGKKNNYQLLPKKLLKFFFQIRFNNGLL